MQTNADRSKKYVVLERTHMAIEKEIQKHRINVEIIKKDYVAICDRRRNWELQSGKLRSTTAACNCRKTAEPADFAASSNAVHFFTLGQACFLQTLSHCLLCKVELSWQQWVSPQFHPWESRPVAEARQALRRRGKLLHDLRRRPRTATQAASLSQAPRIPWLRDCPSPPSARAVAHTSSLRLRLVENWRSKLAHLVEYGWDRGTSASGWRSVASAR